MTNQDLAFLAADLPGLDLANSDDRATFRQRVASRLAATKVEAIREWVGGKARDRDTVVRAVADAFIAERLQGTTIQEAQG